MPTGLQHGVGDQQGHQRLTRLIPVAVNIGEFGLEPLHQQMVIQIQIKIVPVEKGRQEHHGRCAQRKDLTGFQGAQLPRRPARQSQTSVPPQLSENRRQVSSGTNLHRQNLFRRLGQNAVRFQTSLDVNVLGQ